MRARLDRLAKCDSEPARAKQHKAGCDYRWESIGHEVMIAHHTPAARSTGHRLNCPAPAGTERHGAEAADETAESVLRKIGFPVKPSPRAVSAQKNRVLGTSVMFS